MPLKRSKQPNLRSMANNTYTMSLARGAMPAGSKNNIERKEPFPMKGPDKLTIFEINVKTQSGSVVQKLNKIGFKITAKEIETRLEDISVKALNALSASAYKAAISTIPIHISGGGTLRLGIQTTGGKKNNTDDPYKITSATTFRQGTKTLGLSREVYIINNLYTPPRRPGGSYSSRYHYEPGRSIALGYTDLAVSLDHGIFSSGRHFMRTRPSEAVGGYPAISGKTAGWYARAQKEFTIRRPKDLQQAFEKKGPVP